MFKRIPGVSIIFVNGDNRTRTCDPLHVKQMLSQLSYVSMELIISDKGIFDKGIQSESYGSILPGKTLEKQQQKDCITDETPVN